MLHRYLLDNKRGNNWPKMFWPQRKSTRAPFQRRGCVASRDHFMRSIWLIGVLSLTTTTKTGRRKKVHIFSAAPVCLSGPVYSHFTFVDSWERQALSPRCRITNLLHKDFPYFWRLSEEPWFLSAVSHSGKPLQIVFPMKAPTNFGLNCDSVHLRWNVLVSHRSFVSITQNLEVRSSKLRHQANHTSSQFSIWNPRPRNRADIHSGPTRQPTRRPGPYPPCRWSETKSFHLALLKAKTKANCSKDQSHDTLQKVKENQRNVSRNQWWNQRRLKTVTFTHLCPVVFFEFEPFHEDEGNIDVVQQFGGVHKRPVFVAFNVYFHHCFRERCNSCKIKQNK